MNEFDIINKYFKLPASLQQDSAIVTDIGDDCAVLNIINTTNLCISTDTLVSGVHFFHDAPAKSIGHKSLAVNLSDLAAMGASPKWYTLSLTIPEFDHIWLQGFSDSINALATKFNIRLIGGDISRGPLSITITAIGEKNKNILLRSNASAGDSIFITGDLGLPALLLDIISNQSEDERYKNKIIHDLLGEDINSNSNKLYYPTPKVELGLILSDYANSAIDVSDGLLADLGHILKQSNLCANLNLNNLPISSFLLDFYNSKTDNVQSGTNKDTILKHVLTGGDEYELLFTVSRSHIDNINLISRQTHTKITHIGDIVDGEYIDNSTSINYFDDNSLVSKINIKENKCWQHFE